jgi:hypothetical protein
MHVANKKRTMKALPNKTKVKKKKKNKNKKKKR